LAPDAVAKRRERIGGSDANIILSGDRDAVLRLWREKRGEAEPEDLTGVLPVMLGLWSEEFNRLWYEQATGFGVSHIGAAVSCKERPWRACTLDGYVSPLEAVWEAKHTNAFCKSEEAVARYMPQLQHNMAVAGSGRAVLSVIFGNHRWEALEVAADWLYQEELLIAEARFWDCVRSGVEPVAVLPPPPPRVVGTREVCLQGSNAWAAAAADWLKHREAAKLHATSTATLKSLVEEDVGRAFGHRIEAKRSKNGAITIREVAP
jgi:predicted phage-related endonuclease